MKPPTADPTLREVQLLIDRPVSGPIVSCYADRSLTGFVSRWPQHFKNEVAVLEQKLADDRHALQQLSRDITAVRRALASPAAKGACGMAVFSSAARGFLQIFPLGVPVRDALVIDEQPYLVPLLEAIHRQRRYLVVLADSHRGRLYAAGWGRAVLLHEIAENVPRRQRSAGEVWGKQQATIARHREDHALHFRKALVRHVQQAWSDAPFRGLILLGERETLAALRAALPPSLANQIAYEGPYSWTGRQPGITKTVQHVLEQALRGHDLRLVEEVAHRREAGNYCVAAGPQEVIDALRNGQVGYPGYVVLERDRGQSASRCSGCGSVSMDMREACAYCGAACERINLWQEILLFAARHDIPAHVVDDNATMDRLGGVAAMLSREGPWDPVAAGLRVEKRLQP